MVGYAYAVFALIVTTLAMLHIRGNINRFRNMQTQYEQQIKNLKMVHEKEINKLKESQY